MATKALRVIASGRVQGVGYRAFVQHQATALGLVGWVRNLRDGDVEARAEGDETKLVSLLAQMKKGPALARVNDLRITWEAPRGEDQQFRVTY